MGSSLSPLISRRNLNVRNSRLETPAGLPVFKRLAHARAPGRKFKVVHPSRLAALKEYAGGFIERSAADPRKR